MSFKSMGGLKVQGWTKYDHQQVGMVLPAIRALRLDDTSDRDTRRKLQRKMIIGSIVRFKHDETHADYEVEDHLKDGFLKLKGMGLAVDPTALLMIKFHD